MNWIFYQKSKSKQSESSFLMLPIPKDYLQIIDSKDISKVYKALIVSGQQIFNFSSSFLYLFSPQKEVLVCKERLPASKQKLEIISMRNENHYLVRAILDDKPYIVTDVQYDKRIHPNFLSNPSVKSLIAYPLKFYDKVQGVFLMNFEDKVSFTEKQIILFDLLSVISLGIINNIIDQNQLDDLYKGFQKTEEEYREEIKTMQEQLLLSGKLSSLGALASGIAHEIRNPLTIIKMLVDELSKEMKGPDHPKDLEVIKTEINRLEEIITYFLDFARPKPLKKINCNLNRLIRETLNFLDFKLKHRKMKLNLYSTLPNVLCDHNQLKQVFINIILNAENAIQSAGRADDVIEIKTSVQLKDKKKYVKLSFEDSGPGIPSEIIDSLFEPFITTREQGIGLGLSITYRIIENHNGMINAKNRVEGGAKFVIMLPVE